MHRVNKELRRSRRLVVSEGASLQVVPEPLHLREHVVDVALVDGLVGDDAPEEVGVHAERLIADHDAAAVHHATFQLRRHLKWMVYNFL